MAGVVSQTESDIIYARLARLAMKLLSVKEEFERLDAMRVSLDLATNLDAEGGGNLTVAEASALFVELRKFANYWDNVASVASTGTAGSGDRRAKFDPFILAEPLLRS